MVKRRAKKSRLIVCSTGEIVNNYEEYLKTRHWRNKRLQIAKIYNNCCQNCGTKIDKGFHIHHLTYKNIGNEQNFDLAFLCETCHNDLHAKKIKVNFVDQYNKAMAEKDEIKQRTKEYNERMQKYHKDFSQPKKQKQKNTATYKKNIGTVNHMLKQANQAQFDAIIKFIERNIEQYN